MSYSSFVLKKRKRKPKHKYATLSQNTLELSDEDNEAIKNIVDEPIAELVTAENFRQDKQQTD